MTTGFLSLFQCVIGIPLYTAAQSRIGTKGQAACFEPLSGYHKASRAKPQPKFSRNLRNIRALHAPHHNAPLSRNQCDLSTADQEMRLRSLLRAHATRQQKAI